MTYTLSTLIETAGGQSALARALGVSQQRVNYWVKHGKPIPAEYVFKVQEALGVPPHVSRPDLFGQREAAQ